MARAKSKNRRIIEFILGVAVPGLLTIAATTSVVFIGLGRMADEVNTLEAQHAVRAAKTAMASALERIRVGHDEYALWDDAVRNLYGTPNTAFVQENMRDATEAANLFDTAFLIDEHHRTLAAFRNGQPLKGGVEDYIGPGLQLMIDHMDPATASKGARVSFIGSTWGALAVAAGPVLPYSEDIEPPSGEIRILVLATTIGPAMITKLGRDFALPDLHMTPSLSGQGQVLPINNPLGKPVAALTWSARAPGNQAYANALPPALGVLALLGIVMTFLIGVSWRNMQSTYRGEQNALFASLHDPLTALPNRAAFQAALDRSFASADGPEVTVIFLDLDGFKETNDTYGHETGDKLLRAVSDAFRKAVSASGLLVRLGGDEFAVVITGPESTLRGRLVSDRMLHALEEPFDIEGRVVPVGTSIGIATSQVGESSAVELVRRADVAMYAAKEGGKRRAVVYRADLDQRRAERTAIASALRAALAAGDLSVVYQPLVDARTRTLVGVEALLRWTPPGGEPVSPADFIPIAEETGLIDDLGRWVLRKACEDALAWSGLRVSVNVSPAQFRNPNFDTVVRDVLTETGLPASQLEIEITETFLVANPDRAQHMLAAVRQLGVTVALDDFGTGFSSIGYLRRFAFDKVKIDRSLVAGTCDDLAIQKLVHATIAVADALGIRVAAEGIECAAEARLLAEAGCHELQGFYFARPMAAEEIGLRWMLVAPPERRLRQNGKLPQIGLAAGA
ncbi:putative bifunctional diguanylate cyclase/phosphodiesterase [Mongoliimonas terrestris]|uniref:putative bifunctional diguanylate cyclase/phosphodiesterase n=1 Tax=Mongoliimonas terrestris TaxID=1709001 RepID=UPI0009497637|nr:EAL domain-containing protein [Mongoliimonas terrestris]